MSPGMSFSTIDCLTVISRRFVNLFLLGLDLKQIAVWQIFES
jgi:hypothetical protein